MKTGTVRQTATFKAGAHEVYEALMDSKKHSEFTGSQANISRKVGGKISVYDGEIEGVNLELVPDKKIVQSWRYSDWPEGHYSRATFSLAKVAAGTRLTFTQTGVPLEFLDDISQGWRDYYWTPMKEMLDK
jgi:activator of HSP90 ATPase